MNNPQTKREFTDFSEAQDGWGNTQYDINESLLKRLEEESEDTYETDFDFSPHETFD